MSRPRRNRPGIEGIYIGSGISARTEQPFCHVTVQSEDGQMWEGQIEPDVVRRMAFDWLEAAEAAIHDAAVFKMLTTKLSVPEEGAAAFIADLRDYRQDAHTMTDIPDDDD